MFESPISLPVAIRCACCDRRLLRSEVMSCVGCSRRVMRRQWVVVSAVSLPEMYVMCDSECLKRER